MNFYIHTDLPSEEEIAFPEDLSQFFEQYSGFGEESEVAQTELILDIDLSAFQRYNLVAGKDMTWLEVNGLLSTISELIRKVETAPDFHESISFSGVPASEFRKQFLLAQAQKDDKKVVELVKRWQNTPDSSFPPDTGYLRSASFMKDLVYVEKALAFLMKKGAKRVAIMYR